ncbi:MAG: alpha/beta hydrolase [Phycisphaerae bacterium]
MKSIRGKLRCSAILLVLVALLVGCAPNIEAEAKKLIVPDALPGRVMQGLTGTGEQMVAQGRIHHALRVEGYENTTIDVWVINSRMIHYEPTPEGGLRAVRIRRGTVLLLHPLMTSKTWFLELAQGLADRGWDVVLPDLRAHGRSEGEYVTWGAKEKHDIKAVVDELLNRGLIRRPIFVCGASLGGTVAVQYAALDPRCRGCFAIAPPKSFRAISRRILLMLSDSHYEAAYQRALELADFEPDEADAVAAARRLTCPLLMTHGALDFVVPTDHSEAIFQAAAGPKRFLPQFLAGHASEIGKEEWIAARIGMLADMAKEAGP